MPYLRFVTRNLVDEKLEMIISLMRTHFFYRSLISTAVFIKSFTFKTAYEFYKLKSEEIGPERLSTASVYISYVTVAPC